MRVSTFFAEVDQIYDYIPLASTVSNLVDLFLKCVCKCLSEATLKNRYWSHIHSKDLLRCFILLVPIVGNIYVGITDYQQYKRDKEFSDAAVQLNQSTQRMAASSLSMVARHTAGVDVPAEQLMPATTEDQQRLWAACFGDDLQTVRDLLGKSVSPTFYHSGQTPLVTACHNSRPEIVQLLIQAGSDVNTPDRLGMTPLSAACVAGKLEIVQLLRPQIADLDASNSKGLTGLMFAASQGHEDVVRFLVAQRADRFKVTADGIDALAFAIFSDRAHVLPHLLTEEEDIDTRQYTHRIDWFHVVENLTPLLFATLFGRAQSATYLIPRSDVQRSDSHGSTALFYSVKHISVLRSLLSKCQTPEFVNHRNVSGATALHQAIERNQPEAAILLLQNGANPFLPNGFKEFLIAQMNGVSGQPLPVTLLRIVAEYYVRKQDDIEGEIPLVLACEKGMDAVVAHVRTHHGNRITPHIEEQLHAASQVAIADRGQVQPAEPERPNLLASALDLMAYSFRPMQRVAEEVETLGPVPRTGMELLFGRLAAF